MKIEEMEENRVNDIYFTSKRVFLEFFRWQMRLIKLSK
jgi:hypothetical protein